MAKGTGCSGRGLGFDSQHPHRDSTICDSSSKRSDAALRHPQALPERGAREHTCSQNSHTHKLKISQIRKRWNVIEEATQC